MRFGRVCFGAMLINRDASAALQIAVAHFKRIVSIDQLAARLWNLLSICGINLRDAIPFPRTPENARYIAHFQTFPNRRVA
jgi:hypothetical protein